MNSGIGQRSIIKRKVSENDRLSGSITYNELERWKQSEQSRRCNGSQGEDISAFSFLHNGLYVYCAIDWTMVAAGQRHDFGSGVSILGRQN